MKRPRIVLIPVAVLLAGLLLAITGTLLAARPETAAPAVPITPDGSLPIPNIIGFVKDPAAVPVPNASVRVYNDSYWDFTTTNITGSFALADVPPGEYWVQANPPWVAQGLMASEPFTVVLTKPNSLVDVGTITLPKANKVLDGHVYLAGTAQGVPDALVIATRLDAAGYAATTVDGNGAYSLDLTGGQWQIRVKPVAPPADWTFAEPPGWVSFALDDTPAVATVDLEVLAADALVMGYVACPGGQPCAGSPPSGKFWVTLQNDRYHIGSGLDLSYDFAIPVPAGWYELAVFVDDPGYQGPAAQSVYVGSGNILDVGLVEILGRDAHIQGNVINEANELLAGVSVVAWQSDGNGRAWAVTNVDGNYDIPVVGGEWFVTVTPGLLPYVLLNQPPIAVVAQPGAVVSGVNFLLTTADARILGLAVDGNSGNPIPELDGWAWAKRYLPSPPGGLEHFSAAAMWDGHFALKAGGNEQYQVLVAVPPQASYLSGGTGPVSVAPGVNLPVAVPLQAKNAWIGGVLADGLTGTPITGVTAEVYGQDNWGNWVSASVDPTTGEYLLSVAAGTWSLGLSLNPDSGYAAATDEIVVAAVPGLVTTRDVAAWPVDSFINGQTLKPDNLPQPGALVYAQGYSPALGYFETQTTSDENGDFELGVPAGVYTLGASLPAELLTTLGWASPLVVAGIVAEPGPPAGGQFLPFRQVDATVAGLITIAPNTSVDPSHPAYVWAWSDNGERAETAAFFTGDTASYSLNVVSGADWHVGVVYDDWENGRYFIQEEVTVAVPTAGFYGQNLEAAGPYHLPQPLVASFDATTMQSLSLPDGFRLLIPPGALADSGQVTLSIFPTRALRPGMGQPVVGYGYDLRATDENGQEITHFSRNVVMTFPYSEAEVAAAGLSEDQLAPVYYSTLLGEWELTSSYVLDTAGNQITLQVNHFSKFGTLGFLPAPDYDLFLPAILRNGPSGGA